MKSKVILDSLQQNIKWELDSSRSLHLGYRIFRALPILCITGLENIYPEHFLNQSVNVLPQISRLRIWCPSRKFRREMNLKGLLYLVLFDGEVK